METDSNEENSDTGALAYRAREQNFLFKKGYIQEYL